MKKILLVVIVVGLICAGWFLYSRVLSPPPKRACARLAELCSPVEVKGDVSSCEEAFEKLKSAAGQEAIDNAVDCINEADTCVKAAGCMVGVGVGAMGEFMKGFEDALKKSLK